MRLPPQVADVFNPGTMTVTLSVSAVDGRWDLPLPPRGFHCRGSAMQRFASGGHAVFYSCRREATTPTLPPCLPLASRADVSNGTEPAQKLFLEASGVASPDDVLSLAEASLALTTSCSSVDTAFEDCCADLQCEVCCANMQCKVVKTCSCDGRGGGGVPKGPR